MLSVRAVRATRISPGQSGGEIGRFSVLCDNGLLEKNEPQKPRTGFVISEFHLPQTREKHQDVLTFLKLNAVKW